MVPDQWTFGTRNLENLRKDASIQNALRLLYNYTESCLEHWKHSGFNTESQLSSKKLKMSCLSVSILQNKIHPSLHFKERCFSPFFALHRWFHGATAEVFAAGFKPISELMSTKPKPEAGRGNQATWPQSNRPSCFQEHNCAVFCSIYVCLIQPAMQNNTLPKVGQSLACTW